MPSLVERQRQRPAHVQATQHALEAGDLENVARPARAQVHADGAAILQLVQSGKPVTIGPLDRPRQQPAVSDVAFGTPLRVIWLTSERTEGFQ